jgi:TorA maturation chaperone TorD
MRPTQNKIPMTQAMDEELQNDHEQIELFVGQSLLLNLLGMVLFHYPDEDLLPAVLDEEIFSEVPFAGEQPDVISGSSLLCSWLSENKERGEDELLSDIQADYTRLFIGPGKVLAPPYESVHFSSDRLMFQMETLQVRRWYAQFGLQSEKIYNEPDDHIGLEMVFMAHLATQAAVAARQGDDEKLDQLLEAQREFASKHLFRWAFRWCNQVHKEAHTDFFRGIALMTRGSLLELAEMLGVEVQI